MGEECNNGENKKMQKIVNENAQGGRQYWIPRHRWEYNIKKRPDSSVGIVLSYGLDDRGSRVRFPAGAGNFSLHHRVQNGSGAHPTSYPMGTRGSFTGGKAAGS
jgi:hypothetical protein